ncbi:LamG-like jellyroll fold domain-containing protein [Salegentibacter salegens]|uniref:Concanavalin A-like lectin/glucanases superfamily protein n=1 Tax=Salegentibacter salegens TaxID=143223 RepID=A0A1M7IH09_9FLAO|nr:LamG-like jellyroll fold domain-containing protein [Salegentibacter salegens]PRX43755.1 concanavalin A-like lectin/glucanase superfamily protein [Salegentibacter salegens]SHM40031.1 Concanavalin A-like lectin/glucanases superfamily protein [Salegentibacter salegens]
MKKINKYYFGIFSFILLLTSCEYDGIDPLTQVDPGEDAGAPEVSINYPNEGTTIQVPEAVASINIRFEVVDDIEVDMIEVLVNGDQIATFNEFLDYRIVNEEVSFDNVTNGEHTLTINATDIAGNTTSKTVNFSKEPPYTPKYAGEFFYMPFDADFTELVNIYMADETGDPAISGEAYLGTGAYEGVAESYIDVPLDHENLGSEFSGAFWYKVNTDEADRAGILVAGAEGSGDSESRQQGFRLFREGSAEEQTIKMNVGTGTGESWNDGGIIDVTNNEWVHIAFSVTPTETVLYINGMPVNTGTMTAAIDWTGVEQLTIGAGGDTFSYWDHRSDINSNIDELRLFNTTLTQEDIQALINASSITLDMPFNGDYRDMVSNREVTEVGSPGFAGESVEGNNAYAGAEGAYLQLPSDGLLSEEFSTTFWYKVNADPDRAGIITISPEDENNPDAQNNRTSGFRLFREGSADEQRIKANIGNGSADSWNDGGVIDVAAGEWVHVALVITDSESRIYLDGELVNTGAISGGIDWTGTDIVSIMSGAPRFTEWGHLADQSYMDNLRFYNKALTEDEIQTAMAE